MAQNIDSFMRQIKSDGPQQIDITKCVDLNHLHFIKQRNINKQGVEQFRIDKISPKCKSLCENIFFQDLISEIIIDRSEPESNEIFDFRMGKEIQKQFRNPQFFKNQQIYLEYFDLQYTAKLKIRTTSQQDRVYFIQRVNNYIFWILRYHESFEKSLQIKQQTNINNESFDLSLKQMSQSDIQNKISENKQIFLEQLSNVAHITINQIPDQDQSESQSLQKQINFIQSENEERKESEQNNLQKNRKIQGQLLIIIGFNTKRSEVFYYLEKFREFSYKRNQIEESLVPQYNSNNLCGIIYHLLLIFRKILIHSDSNIYDEEVKQIISINFAQIIDDPSNNEVQLKLSNFDECHFQIFEISSSAEDQDKILLSYQFRKLLIINLIESLDDLYILNTEDLAFNLLSDNIRIISCFQYKISKQSDVSRLNQLDAFNKIINKIHQITMNEKIDFRDKQITPKKQFINNTLEPLKFPNKQINTPTDYKSALQTAFSWFDTQKYQTKDTLSRISNYKLKSDNIDNTYDNEKNKEQNNQRGSSYFGTLK